MHPSDSRPIIDGKFFRVGKEKFFVKGITYGPFAPNADGESLPSREQTAKYAQLHPSSVCLVGIRITVSSRPTGLAETPCVAGKILSKSLSLWGASQHPRQSGVQNKTTEESGGCRRANLRAKDQPCSGVSRDCEVCLGCSNAVTYKAVLTTVNA